MKICVLASGSGGNSTYVQTSDYKFLIDLGMSIKYINDKLNKLNTSFDEIDFILITHLHDDHIKTLATLKNKEKPHIYVSEKMQKSLMGKNIFLNYYLYKDDILLDNLFIEKVPTSHDSIDSRGFIISEKNKSFVYITDTGYLNIKNFEKLKNKELYIMESNHDPILLREGKYPFWLQQRVLSDKGHLSNETSSMYLSKLIGPNTKKVLLAHLSKENNRPEIALATFKEKMKTCNIDFDSVDCLKQDEASEVIEI